MGTAFACSGHWRTLALWFDVMRSSNDRASLAGFRFLN